MAKQIAFILTITWFYVSMTTTSGVSMAKPNCMDRCGDVLIPYPFGIGSECSNSSWFTVVCQNTTNPHIPILTSIGLEILYVSLTTMIVKQPIHPLPCSPNMNTITQMGYSHQESPFTIAYKNELVVMGCQYDEIFFMLPENERVEGCLPACGNESSICGSGFNCCVSKDISLPLLDQILQISYRTNGLHTESSTCGYAFLTEEGWWDEYQTYKGTSNSSSSPLEYVPLMMFWAFDSEHGYHCERSNGYEGNPYLPGGCQVIEECKLCLVGDRRGYYCKEDYYSKKFYCHEILYGKKSHSKAIITSVCIALGAVSIVITGWILYKVIKKRIQVKRRQKFFKHNGGLLLEQQMFSTGNLVEKTKVFSSKELAQATNNYNEDRIIGRGGQGTVYKGMLSNGRIVAIKKSRKVNIDDSKVFINEVVILSQVIHRNIVKLLGCCLETEVPLLVYEFVSNGSLFQHIHDPHEEFPFTWNMRLRVVSEVAHALSYLHSSASAPIYHQDVKSTNILLDDKYKAKVADFGTSRSIAIDQTHLTTRVFGTFGYLDPEYLQSNQFTEKSDVYSFGVVMVEILTGEKAISTMRAEDGHNLASHFLHAMEEGCLFDILDSLVLKEGTTEQIIVIAELARRCLHLNGKVRPTMREVTVELERIQTQNGDDVLVENNHHATELQLINGMHDPLDFSTMSESTEFCGR